MIKISFQSTRIKILIIVGFVLIGVAIAVLFQGITAQTQPFQQWKTIKIGVDKKADVIQRLGAPQSSTTSPSGQEILNYVSEYSTWPHQVIIDPSSQRSVLVKERLLHSTKGELGSYIEQYGKPEAIVTTNDDLPALGIYLHVFPPRGVAVNASTTTGAVFEIWYFPLMTLETFKQQFSHELGPDPNQDRRF